MTYRQPHAASEPCRSAAAVTPHDTNLLANAGTLYVGNQGDIAVVTLDGSAVTFKNVVGFIPVVVKQVKATGTTATLIVVCW